MQRIILAHPEPNSYTMNVSPVMITHKKSYRICFLTYIRAFLHYLNCMTIDNAWITFTQDMVIQRYTGKRSTAWFWFDNLLFNGAARSSAVWVDGEMFYFGISEVYLDLIENTNLYSLLLPLKHVKRFCYPSGCLHVPRSTIAECWI